MSFFDSSEEKRKRLLSPLPHENQSGNKMFLGNHRLNREQYMALHLTR